MVEQPVRVGCYSGGRYGERPQWVEREGRRVAIASINAEWRQQERLVFQVTLEDRERLILYYYVHKDIWLAVKKE